MENTWLDLAFEEEFGESLPFEPDLDNFPNPSDFMCLKVYGLSTEQEFILWWKVRTGNTIRKFRSFSPSFQPATENQIDSVLSCAKDVRVLQ